MISLVSALTLLRKFKPLMYHRILIAVVSGSVILSSIISIVSLDVGYVNIKNYDTGDEYHIDAVISEIVSTTSYNGYYIARVMRVNGEKDEFKIKLEVSDGYLEMGDVIETDVVFYSLSEDIDGFAEERYYLSKNVMMNAYVPDGAEVVTHGTSVNLFDYITMYRKKLSSIIHIKLNGKDYGISSALFLGDKYELSDSLSRDISRLGISHILAVSGMHLVILIGGCDYFISLIGINRRKRCFIVIPLTILYMALTGFASSILRAGIMLIIARMSDLLGNESDSMTSLFFSGALICLINPMAVFDIGFQLSFTATFTLIIGIPLYQKSVIAVKLRKLASKGSSIIVTKIRKIIFSFISSSVLMFLMSLLISFTTLPIVWLHFGKISVIAPISNFIFNPMFTALLFLIPVLIILRPLTSVTYLISKIIIPICDFIVYLASKIGGLPNIYQSVQYWFSLVFIVIIFVSVMSFMLLSKKKRLISFISLTASVLLFIGCIAIAKYSVYDDTYITYLNYKKNDGFVITHHGKVLICDISDGSYSISRKGLYQSENLAYCEIEVLMLTHYHQRHIASLTKLSDRTYVRQLWLPEPVSESDFDIYASLIETAEAKNILCHTYTRAETAELDFFGVNISVIEYSSLKRSTHPVIALSVDSGSGSLAYIGASSYEVSNDFVRNSAENSDVVVFGIHGPVYKTPYSYSFSKNSKNLALVIFSGDDSRMYADSSMNFGNARIIDNKEYHRIVFKAGD